MLMLSLLVLVGLLTCEGDAGFVELVTIGAILGCVRSERLPPPKESFLVLLGVVGIGGVI